MEIQLIFFIKHYAGNYIYENNVLQFFSHSEGYVTPDGNGGYDYVYQYTDHLGNIRLSYSDSDNNGSIDPSTEILEENNYYPMGLKHRGYNSNINGVEHKWKYNGKELQDELDLNWYDLGARNLDHALGRFMNVDPRAEEYNFQSPYAFANNNPVLFVDINGEGVDWIPEVDDKGNITYIAETGDSAKSLSDQFGIKQSDAEKITETTGSNEINAGTKITGEKVASSIEGNDSGILRLDTKHENTTDADIVNQAVFAFRNENAKDFGDSSPAVRSFNLKDYFNTGSTSNSTEGTFNGVSTNHRLPISIDLGNGTVAKVSLSFHTANNGNVESNNFSERQLPPNGERSAIDFYGTAAKRPNDRTPRVQTGTFYVRNGIVAGRKFRNFLDNK